MGALVYLCGVYVVYVARVVDDVYVGRVMLVCMWSVLSIGVCGVYKCVGYVRGVFYIGVLSVDVCGVYVSLGVWWV